MEAIALVELIALVVKNGAPAVTAAIEAWGKDDITLDDIRALVDRIKRPEDYFDSPTGS